VTRVLERTEGFRQLLGNILTVNAALVAQRQNDKLTPRVSQLFVDHVPAAAQAARTALWGSRTPPWGLNSGFRLRSRTH
jgi:hypothetical protein